ncbi:MAG: GNAT family N-acetyltransferase [Nocardioides sp.]|nr:GNAT family N-acetyltransferase [Nocardioides sp.]
MRAADGAHAADAADAADAAAVRRVVAAAFGDERPLLVRLLDELDRTERVVASLVAEVDGAVVGHVQLSRSWVDARERLVEVVVLSPLSVHPDVQRTGVGSALLAAAVEVARAAAEPAVFLEGSPAYYGERGWQRASSLGFTRPSARIPDAAFQVVLLVDDLPRGALVYCDAFWALDCVGLRDPFLAEIEERFAD